MLLSIAKVVIVALIDEATGYQAVRSSDALQVILEKYLRKELAAWAKNFPTSSILKCIGLKGGLGKGEALILQV